MHTGLVPAWSWQTPDSPLNSGKVDHRKGRFWREYPTVRALYPKLHDFLGTDQLIWCHTSFPAQWLVLEECPMTLWAFRLPLDKLRFVNQQRWSDLVQSDEPTCLAFSIEDVFLGADSSLPKSAVVELDVAKRCIENAATAIGRTRTESPTTMFKAGARVRSSRP
jgi:hypothetical protein